MRNPLFVLLALVLLLLLSPVAFIAWYIMSWSGEKCDLSVISQQVSPERGLIAEVLDQECGPMGGAGQHVVLHPPQAKATRDDDVLSMESSTDVASAQLNWASIDELHITLPPNAVIGSRVQENYRGVRIMITFTDPEARQRFLNEHAADRR